MITLDFVNTLAGAGLVLFLGYALQRRIRPLARYNIPAPVVGGLLVALVVTALRAAGYQPVTFEEYQNITRDYMKATASNPEAVAWAEAWDRDRPHAV